MDSSLTFGIAHLIGMTVGGVLAHIAVKTFQDKTSLKVLWGENDSVELRAPYDVLKTMHVFATVKNDVAPHFYDQMCYCLQVFYANLAEISSTDNIQITHDHVYQGQGLVERVVSDGAAFLRQAQMLTPEAYDDIESAYNELEQTLEQEINSLRYFYERSL